MAKYLVTWESNVDKFPTDQNERMAGIMKSMEVTKEWLKANPKNDWGIIIGETSGYAIAEGDPAIIMKASMQLFPYYSFKVHQVWSASELEEFFKAMMAMAPK